MFQTTKPAFLSLSLFLLLLVTTHSAAQELTNDIRVTSELTRNGQIDSYFFDADVDDTVYLTVADRDNTFFNPFVQVFDPNGVLLASVTASFTALVDGLIITTPGRHAVIVQDSGADNLGIYTVNFVRVIGANEGGLLANDTRRTGTLELGDFDSFTFDAKAGERIHLNVADINNTFFNPDLRLHDPSGTLVASDIDSFTATLRNVEITASGIWTVILGDSGADNAGDYELFFALVPGSNEKGLLPNDANRSGTLALGDIDTWRFTAGTGDIIHLNIADIDNTFFNPDLLVYDPDGTLVFTDADSFTAHMNGFEVLIPGIYTVVVKDVGADNTGEYDLYFSRAPGASELGTLISGEVLTGTIDLGDIDTFEFGARAGATVRINVGDTDNTFFNPSVVVYDEAGVSIAADIDSFTASLSFGIVNDGYYTVVLQDSGANNAGAYTLDYLYIGAQPPQPGRSIVLEPYVWHQMGIPGDTAATFGELFGTVFDLNNYGDSAPSQTWIIYTYEPDPASGPSGDYRKVEISEPIPAGKGFWLMHLSDTGVRLNLPIGTANAVGSPGNGCVTGLNCIAVPLARSNGAGGWATAAVPSIRKPSVDSLRFDTDDAAPACSAGCTLEGALVAEFSDSGVWHYDFLADEYEFLSGSQVISPWQGFWAYSASSAANANPRLLIPVQ